MQNINEKTENHENLTNKNKLDKLATSIVSIGSILDDLEEKINSCQDVIKEMNSIYLVAYKCRIEIQNPILDNYWWPSIEISIGSTLDKTITIDTGFKITVERLCKILEKHIDDNSVHVYMKMTEILGKRDFYYEFEKSIKNYD